MSMKRKFESDSDILLPNKQFKKNIPFPHYEPDLDVVMSEPDTTVTAHHIRIPSNASTASTDMSDNSSPDSVIFPSFDIQRSPSFFRSDGTVDPDSHNYSRLSPDLLTSTAVRLLQPNSNLVHHGSHCSQIPKLRIACASGLNGTRTMWSHCEQCGAISMVDTD